MNRENFSENKEKMMKIFKMNLKLLLFTFLSSMACYAQLEDGTYRFTDENLYDVDLTICDDGNSVCEFTFYHDANLVTTTSQGEWFRVNPNGVDEDYGGPWGWYQIQTEEEYFEIELLSTSQIKVIRGDIEIYLHATD